MTSYRPNFALPTLILLLHYTVKLYAEVLVSSFAKRNHTG